MEQPLFIYSLLHSNYFETLDQYQPGRELRIIATDRCPQGWVIEPKGFWTFCFPPQVDIKLQGWKIHASGTEATATELLNRLVPLLVEESVPFKFCSDLAMVRLSTGKNWNRTAAGKIVTIYPKDREQFITLIERCYSLTRDLAGPYILTDRPYKDSRVVFYRYGGHRSGFQVSPEGLRIPVLLTPSGGYIRDERRPFFQVPAWETNPFEQNDASATHVLPISDVILKFGRYKVNGAKALFKPGWNLYSDRYENRQ